jgi:hypothetical protein
MLKLFALNGASIWAEGNIIKFGMNIAIFKVWIYFDSIIK